MNKGMTVVSQSKVELEIKHQTDKCIFILKSRESDDLSVKARSRFVINLRSLSQPMSLGEMAKMWDACSQRVITEYAQLTGGGTFSSRNGAWENCVGA